MKKLIIVCATLLIALGIVTNQGHSENPPLDLGQTDLVLLSCNIARDNIEVAHGQHMTSCRRSQPDVISSDQAVITIAVRVNGASKSEVKFVYRRSLWWPSALVQVN